MELMFEQNKLTLVIATLAIAFTATATIATTVYAESDGVPNGNAWGLPMGEGNQNDGVHGFTSGFSDNNPSPDGHGEGAVQSDGTAIHIDDPIEPAEADEESDDE